MKTLLHFSLSIAFLKIIFACVYLCSAEKNFLVLKLLTILPLSSLLSHFFGPTLSFPLSPCLTPSETPRRTREGRGLRLLIHCLYLVGFRCFKKRYGRDFSQVSAINKSKVVGLVTRYIDIFRSPVSDGQ